MSSTITKFVSQKVNRVRWKPISQQISTKPDLFITGSWDDSVNKISLWTLNSPRPDYNSINLNVDPQLLCESVHRGDVTDLQFINGNLIAATSSLGNVSLIKHNEIYQNLEEIMSWRHLHSIHGQSSPCTSITLKGDDTAVTAGEDGRLCVLNLEHQEPVKIIDNADCCSLNAAKFLNHSEVAAVNSVGHLKVWDLRNNSDDSSRTLHLAGEQYALHCLDKHPTQPHILATGGQKGTLCIWDMRMDKFPVKLLAAHSSDIWEVKFHPTDPDNLFSCSDDGTLWHWDSSGRAASGTGPISTTLNSQTPSLRPQGGTSSAWLASDAQKHRLDITDLLEDNSMPVNTLDILDTTLLCGTDGEQIYVIRNLPIS